MVLVDTSVWVDHFRMHDVQLAALLHAGEVTLHPFVIGELACGQLPQRTRTLHLLGALPSIPALPDRDVHFAIEHHRWFGQGIGWTDAHLLSAALVSGTPLWTRDQRLSRLAHQLGIGS